MWKFFTTAPTLTTTTRSYRTLCDVSALALSLITSKTQVRSRHHVQVQSPISTACPVYKEAKYGTSYWPQKFELEQFRGMEEANRLWELNKDPTSIFSPKSVRKLIMQKYNKVTSNIKNKQTSGKYWKKIGQKDLKSIKDPFSQQNCNNLYNFDLEEETVSNIKDA